MFIFDDAKFDNDNFTVTVKALKALSYKKITVSAGNTESVSENGSLSEGDTLSFDFSGIGAYGGSFEVKCICDGEEISYKYVDSLPQLSISNVSIVAKELTNSEIANLMVLLPDDSGRNLCGYTYEIERLGVPSIVMGDGTSGLRTNTNMVAFPTISVLANSWNDALVEKTAYNEGLICRDFGVDVLLSPGVNIKKNTLNGRNFEYVSEDPLLSGYLGAAYVNGLQKTGVGACVKHYLANNQETSRSATTSDVSERALREIYARSFEYVLNNSNPLSIMTSYNKVNGKYLLDNEDCVRKLLRNEFDFSGIAISDWGANGSAENMINSGMNIVCGFSDDSRTSKVKSIENALESNKYAEELVEETVTELLSTISKSTAMSEKNAANEISDIEDRLSVAREAAAEGMVLLKNEDALPFKKGTVALFSSDNFIIGGGGSSGVSPTDLISITEGFENYENVSCKSCDINNVDISEFGIALYVISRDSTEGTDMDDTLFNLTDSETEAIKNISETFHSEGKKLVVAINTGNPIEVESWKDMADAIIYVGFAGEQAGNAFADIFTGAVNPSGKLTETWPKTLNDTPGYDYFPGTALSTKYYEDIYVGYRYYETFDIDVSFEFGYGLTYSNFKYSDFKVTKKANGIELSVKITNKGSASGKEIVEFYMTIPDGTNEHPVRELCGYAKTKTLGKGKSQVVTVFVDNETLKTYKDGTWFTEDGTYKFAVGASVSNIKFEKDLALTGETVKTVETIAGSSYDVITKETGKVVVPERENIALNKPCKASFCESSNYPASAAVDGSKTTRWSGAGCTSSKIWWQVDLEEEYDIIGLRIDWESNLGQTYCVYGSLDKENWTLIGEYPCNENLNVTLETPVRTRYIKVEQKTAGWISIITFAAYVS